LHRVGSHASGVWPDVGESNLEKGKGYKAFLGVEERWGSKGGGVHEHSPNLSHKERIKSGMGGDVTSGPTRLVHREKDSKEDLRRLKRESRSRGPLIKRKTREERPEGSKNGLCHAQGKSLKKACWKRSMDLSRRSP